MAQRVSPLYGRFDFPHVKTFIQRLQQVADSFMDGTQFNTYIATHNKERFYGLDYVEIEEVMDQHGADVKAITTSVSGSSGKSVNVKVQFEKKSGRGEGNFVVVAGSTYENNQVSQILRGEWEAPSADREAHRKALGALIKLVQGQAMKRAAIEAQRKVVLAAQKEAARPKSRTIQTISDAFAFDDQVPVDTLINLLGTLSEKYLDQAPFNIRLITIEGEPYSDIGTRGLRRFMERRRDYILKVFMDAATNSGELVDIMLGFGPMARQENAEVEITALEAPSILQEIRKVLDIDQPADIKKEQPSLVHEMFRFEWKNFDLERTIRMVQTITQKYLKDEAPTAFLSTIHGETYPALDLGQLPSIYRQHEDEISFLLFGVNQVLSGQTFSLMFHFHAPGNEPYGSLSMMWGNEETHRMIRAVIWEQLNLKAYYVSNPEDAPGEKKQKGQRATSSPSGQDMVVNPAFGGRAFVKRVRTAVVIMPLEAYWSATLWMHIQATLKATGWDAVKAEAIFAESELEPSWTVLNEVDLIIADLTYKHPDVFYKAGIAHTLGKSTIFITQHARDLPPDFRRFPHIVYDNNIHGLQKLADHLTDLLKQTP